MSQKQLVPLSLWDSLRINTRDRIQLVERFAAKGDYLQLPMGSYFFNSANAFQHVLHTKAKYFEKQGTPYDLMTEALGPGVLTLDGESWQNARKQYHRLFFAPAIEQLLPTITRRITQYCQTFHDKQFSLTTMITPLITELMLKVLCGYSTVEFAQTTAEILQCINKEVSRFSPFARPIAKRKNLQKRLSVLEQGLLEMVPNFSPQALLGPLIEAYQKQNISREAFLGELKNFLVAGAETTALTLVWTIYNLTTHPDAYGKIKQEVQNTPPPEKWLGAALPYTQHCLEETMRLYPPIWSILRKSRLTHQFGPIQIKKNQIIMLSPYTLHRHPDYWSEPLKFIPERFDNKHKAMRENKCYIPFGLGKRTCIGQQLAMGVMKAFLYALFSQYEVLLKSKAHPGLQPLVTLQPKTPLIVEIVKR